MKRLIKNKITLNMGIIMVLFIILSCETNETQTVATLTNLVWQDEFNTDGAPNSQNWNIVTGNGSDTDAGAGWGNNELQVYTADTKNITIQNGVLIITADKEGSGYTSARINTKGKFQQQYGRFEARIKVPTGKGLWPAFWLLGDDANGTQSWPQIGEIDIMEYLGDKPSVVFGTIHGPGFSGGESISKEYELLNDRFDTGFHVFGIEWSPNQINYYIDGDLYQTLTPKDVEEETDGQGEWVFNRPFYIILNMAVGGNLPGAPDANTVFPQRMLVDYVRVYN
jgi:beta-glucanase (GH16 family)